MATFLKVDAINGLRRFFYAVTPNETSFETVEEVPKYVIEAVPFFIVAVILEEIYLRYHDGGKGDRFADGITSMVAGQFMEVSKVLTRMLELGTYMFVYENYCLVQMPWDNVWTWILTAFGIDFAYYWFHRMAHEVNIIWAAHQMHHSSEEYNFTTALRQSVFQRYFSWTFYIPLALFAPPSQMLVHTQFNLLFQFWIHTELIGNLGPLEYILNTPSHHRVHHGRNPYCIDKNYAGTLIIWDRMFGTFAAESEEVAYGLVHPITTYEPISAQICHFQWVWSQFWSTSGLMNKLRVIFYGPGWGPGKPRTGLIEDIPHVKGPELNKYNTPIPGWLRAYIMLHFVLNVAIFQVYLDSYESLSQFHASLGMVFLISTFTCIGMLCDLKPWWNVYAEMARCSLAFAMTSVVIHQDSEPNNILLFLQVTFGLSLVFWLLRPASVQGMLDKQKSA